ncbi:MAG: hypothetical protein ACJAYX_003827, partial [Planctomycetota bacterium]
TTITAIDAGSGVNASTTLTVTSAVLVSLAVTPPTPSIALGTTQQFTATGTYSDSTMQDLTSTVTWSSTAPAVATISNAGGSEGLATSATQGTTTITAIDAGSGVNASTTLTVTSAVLVSLAVTPATPAIVLGGDQQFTATGTYSDSTTQDLTSTVTWTSSVMAVATISNAGGSEGLASSASSGSTTVTSTDSGSGLFDTATLTVIADIAVRAANSNAEPSGVLSIVVATPSGTLAGDVMLATLATRPMTAVVTPPTGWNLVRRNNNTSGVAHSLAVYVRVAAESEPASHSWSLSTSTGMAASIVTFVGVDGASAIDVHDGQSTASSLSHPAPSVTTTAARTMLLTMHCFGSSASWTPPSGMTEVVDIFSEASASAAGISLSCNYELQAAIGATGARTAVASGDSDTGSGITVALRPML